MIEKVLIVDDDDYKIKNIKDLIHNINRNIEISTEKALNSGLRKIRKTEYDVIILDMSLPFFNSSESSNFNPFGGISFLREMRRKKIMTPVIIVTQYEIFGEGEFRKTSSIIDKECKIDFKNYKGIIIYSSVNNVWKEQLVKMMGDIKNDKSVVC